MIVSDHQTNSHSYVCALAPFSSGAVPQRPLKAKELKGQGFKPISCLGTVAITALLVSSFIWGKVYLCRLHKCVFISRGERRVTVKNSHQRACHFPVAFRLTPGFSDTLVHLVMSLVKTHSNLFLEECGKYLFSRASLRLAGTGPAPYAFEMRRQVSIMACTTHHFFFPPSLFHSVCYQPQWKCLQIRNV